jgi:alkylated DNA nucleotide flippase Atl1
MSAQERELWGNAKGLPEGYVILHRSEIARMAGATRAAGQIVDSLYNLLAAVKRPGEEPMGTLGRMIRDLGRLTIERDAYKFQLDEEQTAAAVEEIKAKLQPKKKT